MSGARRSFALRRRVWLAATLLLAVATMGWIGWLGREWLLPVVAAPLVAEDALAPVDVIVASTATARADTLEAARLYSEGIGKRIVVVRWRKESLDDEMRQLGVPWLPPTELAVAMLERSGVPSDAIRVLEGPVDGLNTEIAVIARFAAAERPASLLYVTARSHSGRARRLLARLLPAETALTVRAPRTDPFAVGDWWRARMSGREVAMEYLRWANTFVFRDPWSAEPPPVPEAAD